MKAGDLQLWGLPIDASSQLAGEPALQTGMHLRWTVSRADGFPRGGYYLLRCLYDGADQPVQTSVPYKFPYAVASAPSGDRSNAYWTWHAVRLVEKVASFPQQPIPLPYFAPDYPPSTKFADAKTLLDYAKSRVQTDPKSPEDWRVSQLDEAVASLPELAEQLAVLVSQSAGAGPVSARAWKPPAALPTLSPADAIDRDIEGMGALDTVLLPIAYPTYAQLLGTYAVDQRSGPGTSVLYLLIADHDNVFGCDVDAAIAAANTWKLEGYSGLSIAMLNAPIGDWAEPLSPPEDVLAYCLPPASERNVYTPQLSSASVGLVWRCSVPTGLPKSPPPKPVLFGLRRTLLEEPTTLDWQDPLSRTSFGNALQQIADVLPSGIWHLANSDYTFADQGAASGLPDPRFPPVAPQFVDDETIEVWSAYRVRAMDWFGRVSDWSERAAWKSWTWQGDPQRKPWYFAKADSAGVVNKHFVLPADLTAPQGPAFDLRESKLLPDGSLEAQLSWNWGLIEVLRAPRVRSFRIYARLGEANVYRGQIAAAFPDGGPGYVSVLCQMPMFLQQPKATKDCVFRTSGLSVVVLDATTVGGQLKLRFELPSGRTAKDFVPGSRCSLVVPPGHKLWREAADVRDGSWQRVEALDLSAAKSIRLEAWRASSPAPLTGPATSLVASRWKVTLASEFPLNAMTNNGPVRYLYLLTASGTHWLGELLHFDQETNEADLRVQKLPINKVGVQPQTQWLAGNWSDNQFTPYKQQPSPGVDAVELVGIVTSQHTTAFSILAGGVVPLTGVQPGFQRLRISGLTGVAAAAGPLEILWYDAESRQVEFALTAGNVPIQLAPDASWQIGQVGEKQFEVDDAWVDQPLIGDVVAAQPQELTLGGPAPLETFQSGARFLIVGTKQGAGLNLNAVALFAVRQLNPTTRTVKVEGELPEALLLNPSDYRWAMGDLTYQFERTVTLPPTSVVAASDGVSARVDFAVTAVEDRPWMADWLTYGGYQGLFGCEGGAAYAKSCRVELPLAPIVLPSTPTYEYRLASPPDIDGKSYVTLRWPKSVGGVAVPAVRILRANANAVFLASEPQVPDQVMVTETVISNWLTKKSVPDQFTAAANSNARRCYAPVTAMPLQTGACPDVVGPDDPSAYTASQDEAAFVDTLDGQVPGRWFYRIEPLDAQGMPAASGAVIGVVVQGVERPAAPVLLDAYFGTEAEHKLFSEAKTSVELLAVLEGIKERTISLVWRHDSAQDNHWVVDAEREDGMFKESKVYPPFLDATATTKMQVNFAVPTAGRWRVGVRAVSLGEGAGSASSSLRLVGVA